MYTTDSPLPDHYRGTLRLLIRFAIVMAFISLLSGVAFQESSKKLDHGLTPSGDPGRVWTALGVEATLQLALVHGHVMVVAVILPIVLAAMLLIARRVGGAELRPKWLRWLTRGYLPSVTVSLVLMLWKGYHILLSVRGGATDLEEIDGAFFFGQIAVRHAVYGVAHVAMAVSLVAFLIGLWKSLKPAV